MYLKSPNLTAFLIYKDGHNNKKPFCQCRALPQLKALFLHFKQWCYTVKPLTLTLMFHFAFLCFPVFICLSLHSMHFYFHSLWYIVYPSTLLSHDAPNPPFPNDSFPVSLSLQKIRSSRLLPSGPPCSSHLLLYLSC